MKPLLLIFSLISCLSLNAEEVAGSINQIDANKMSEILKHEPKTSLGVAYVSPSEKAGKHFDQDAFIKMFVGYNLKENVQLSIGYSNTSMKSKYQDEYATYPEAYMEFDAKTYSLGINYASATHFAPLKLNLGAGADFISGNYTARGLTFKFGPSYTTPDKLTIGVFAQYGSYSGVYKVSSADLYTNQDSVTVQSKYRTTSVLAQISLGIF
jgi:hypothetical protein